jgi:copper homeostasis protein
MLVEVCANSLQSALNAQTAGADRIELCSELAVGGITPSYGLLKIVREKVQIPIHVLIRPRSGDFTFSDDEFNIMKMNIDVCKELGFDGVVSGALHSDYSLDNKGTKELIEAAGEMKFTFHRAFDWVKNPYKTLEELEILGVDYILTSGQKTAAPLGLDLLCKLQQHAKHCMVMPGSGINELNVNQFKNKGFKAVHLSAARYTNTIYGEPKVSMNSASFLHDNGVMISNQAIISSVVNAVK